jgi:hypothetical protein
MPNSIDRATPETLSSCLLQSNLPIAYFSPCCKKMSGPVHARNDMITAVEFLTSTGPSSRILCYSCPWMMQKLLP